MLQLKYRTRMILLNANVPRALCSQQVLFCCRSFGLAVADHISGCGRAFCNRTRLNRGLRMRRQKYTLEHVYKGGAFSFSPRIEIPVLRLISFQTTVQPKMRARLRKGFQRLRSYATT